MSSGKKEKRTRGNKKLKKNEQGVQRMAGDIEDRTSCE